jgi:two-component system, sensor histidine kinase and response regulator
MPEAAQPETVVVIDDDDAMRLSCRKILAKMGFRAETFEDGSRGLEGVARLKPDLVVVDLKMPGITGLEVIARVHEIDPQIAIVVITGYATIDTAVEAMKSGAYDFLPKPFSPDELRLIVNRAIEHRRLTREARQWELEKSLQKRRFITFVSHQLQTPLVAIHQCLEAARRLDNTPEQDAKRREWIDRCLRRSAELQGLIRDWLNLAKLEGEALSRRRDQVEINTVLCEIVNGYLDMAAAEGVTLAIDLPADPYYVAGDRTCIAVLFDNLVSNAIKYNKPGGRVEVSGCMAAGEVVVSISDTGVGIPGQYIPMLFDEFFRVRGEGAKRTAGSGLGLHISRKIASEMGGTIEVESESGRGSVFRVRLPAYGNENRALVS